MRIRIRIQSRPKVIFFYKKLHLLIIRKAFIKDVQATGEVFISQKKTTSTSKLKFSSLWWVILALLDPDPDPADQDEWGSVRIRIRNTAYNPPIIIGITIFIIGPPFLTVTP
jgi:hypothetical protein